MRSKERCNKDLRKLELFLAEKNIPEQATFSIEDCMTLIILLGSLECTRVPSILNVFTKSSYTWLGSVAGSPFRTRNNGLIPFSFKASATCEVVG